MKSEILRMEHITKTFSGVKALDDVSFDLRSGEVHALMGANGAGKSTLMKVLAGVYTADTGKLYIDGKEILLKAKVSEAQKDGISMVFQELNILPHLSVLENIFIANELMKNGLYDWKAMKKRAQFLLDEVDIELDLDERADHISVAMQQMVEIVRALNLESRVIIFDEPTSSLSVQEVEKLFELMGRLREKGIAMVYISHRMDEIYRICDRITLMRDGKVIFCDDIENVDNHRLVTGIVGSENINQFPGKPTEIGDTIFEAKNISCGSFYHDVSFELKKGEILGFAGLAGAGRTEIAKTIFGYYPLEKGELYFHGEKLKVRSPEDAVNQGIGYVSEDRKAEGILGVRSIRENMGIASMKLLCRSGVINQKLETGKVSDLAKELKIKATGIEQKIESLSGGNQQKVCLAKWIMMNPRLLILDEPTRGIDVGARADFYKIINDLVKQDIGVIVISSEEDELIGLCNRIIIMREGEKVGEFSSEEENLKTKMMELMIGIE